MEDGRGENGERMNERGDWLERKSGKSNGDVRWVSEGRVRAGEEARAVILTCQ
jgi:hypothetical protein